MQQKQQSVNSLKSLLMDPAHRQYLQQSASVATDGTFNSGTVNKSAFKAEPVVKGQSAVKPYPHPTKQDLKDFAGNLGGGSFEQTNLIDVGPLLHLQSQIDQTSLQEGSGGQGDGNFNKSMSPLNFANSQQLQVASNSTSYFPMNAQNSLGQQLFLNSQQSHMILFNNNSSNQNLVDLIQSSNSLNTPGSNFVAGVTNPFNRSNPMMGSKEVSFMKSFIKDGTSSRSNFGASSQNQTFGDRLRQQQQETDGPLLSKEMKKLRLRISDYNQSPVLEAICLKMWRLMLVVQYEEVLMDLIPLPSKLPLDLQVYQSMLPLFQRALGIYFFSDYYVARDDVYKGRKVYFPRFAYDLISMFGLHLFYIEVQTLELLLRQVYGAITHNFEAGKVSLKSIESVQPAFTQREFNEAIVLQNKEEQKLNKLHLQISQENFPHGESGVDIGGTRGPEDEEENENENAGNKELFSGLLGNGDENVIEIKARKRKEKLQLVAQINSSRSLMQPFVYSSSFIKQDPLKAMQIEDKREKNKPNSILPEEPTRKLQDKLKKELQMNSKSQSNTKPPIGKNTSLSTTISVASPRLKVGNQEDQSLKTITLTTKRLTRADLSTMKSTEEASAPKISEKIKVIERSPLQKNFASKAELQQTDQARLSDYNMYWHLKEFDPIDMDEAMELDEKYKRKKKLEQMLQKFREMPESEQIKKFIKYERVNFKTQLYNKSRKIDSIMKQLNSNNPLVEKDEDGIELMGFTENGRKMLTYRPKIQLQKEVSTVEDDSSNFQLIGLMDQSLDYQQSNQSHYHSGGLLGGSSQSTHPDETIMNLSPIPIGAHPSHVNVQQFQISQIDNKAIRNLNVKIDPKGRHPPNMDDVSETTRMGKRIETQMEQRLRSTIAREEPQNANSVMRAEGLAQMKNQGDVNNKTAIKFSPVRPNEATFNSNSSPKKQENVTAHDHYQEDVDSVDMKAKQFSNMKPLQSPYPENRQQSQGVFGSRKNLVKSKKNDENLSVSTLSNDEYRKRKPSQMQAKYREVAQQFLKRKNTNSPKGDRGSSGVKKKMANIARNSLGTSGSRKLLTGNDESESSPAQQEINTDISQFLNTKQTFNHSLAGVTHTESGEKEELLDRDSEHGQKRSMGGIKFTTRIPVNVQDGIVSNEFSHKFNSQHPAHFIAGPGTVIFNHNHQPVENPMKRHNYVSNGINRPLNNAANMIIQQNQNLAGITFGKFGQKHVLNKYGRPINMNKNISFGQGPIVTRNQMDLRSARGVGTDFSGDTFQAQVPNTSYRVQPTLNNADPLLSQLDAIHQHGNTTNNSPRSSKRKSPVSIHPVVMGDFQLQDWRSMQKATHSPISRAQIVSKANVSLSGGRNHQGLNTIR